MKSLVLWCVLTVLAGGAAVGSYKPIPLPFVDDAGQSRDLARFSQQVLEMATRHADNELLAVVESSTSEALTRATTVERELRDLGERRWRQLKRALALGGAFTTSRGAVAGRREFCAPYTYGAFPT